MLSLTIVVLLTSDLSILDVKDDAMVCLCTALSFTPSYGTPLLRGNLARRIPAFSSQRDIPAPTGQPGGSQSHRAM